MSLPAPKVLAAWRRDIRRFAWDNFRFEPDAWQQDFFDAWNSGAQRIALKACKGPGKTAVEAIAMWQFLATRPHPKIAATSITADNLSDCLWTELAKWQRLSPFLLQAFEWTKTRIAARDHIETWWASARSWSRTADADTQAATLAGLHADYMLFVIDESGGMPLSVMVAAEAALATGIEVRLLQAGNPIQCDGPLWVACNRDRALWSIIEVTGDPANPKRSARISKQWALDQIQAHGADNPWVLANVFGQFPPSSPTAFIGRELAEDASKREARCLVSDALVIGVDVARFGLDKSVIYPRKGRDARSYMHERRKFRNLDTMQLAARVAEVHAELNSDAIFVDEGGMGGGVVDRLHQLRVPNVIGVDFGKRADRTNFGTDAAGNYANKGSEMWGTMKAWLKRGSIPADPELMLQLEHRRYAYVVRDGKDSIILEPVEEMKKRGLNSPDEASALCLTFAYPVAQNERSGGAAGGSKRKPVTAETEYDPFADHT